MKLISHLLTRRRLTGSAILFLLICGIALGLRLINLTAIPIFADEAIYIRWAQVMRAEPTLRFLPLSDGKQPLFMWVVIPFLKLMQDPLVAGRMVSVLTGLGTLLGISYVSFITLRSKKAALLSALLYALSPYMFFFDRMALVDSMLAFFGIWFFALLITAIKYTRFDFAMLAGIALGGALLTKSPALFFLLLMPLSIVFIPLKPKVTVVSVAKVVAIWITAGVIGFGVSQIMRLGPNYHMIALRNLDYVFPFSHILENPADPFVYNVDRALEWIVMLAPVEVLLLAIIGFLASAKRLSFRVLFFVAAFSLPLLAASMYARTFTARYALYTLPPLFVLAGFSVFASKKIIVPLVLLFVGHALAINYLFLTTPTTAPLPRSEKSGYFEEWSAGWGIAETAEYVKKYQAEHPTENIVIGTEGYFGTLPDGLQVYLEKIPRVTVIGTGLNFKELPDPLTNAKKSGAKTFFVANSSRINKQFDMSKVQLVYSFAKPIRTPNTHEFVEFGPQETYYFFELK